jgi:hypothetical protein
MPNPIRLFVAEVRAMLGAWISQAAFPTWFQTDPGKYFSGMVAKKLITEKGNLTPGTKALTITAHAIAPNI